MALRVLTQPQGPHQQPIGHLSRESDAVHTGGHTVQELFLKLLY